RKRQFVADHRADRIADLADAGVLAIVSPTVNKPISPARMVYPPLAFFLAEFKANCAIIHRELRLQRCPAILHISGNHRRVQVNTPCLISPEVYLPVFSPLSWPAPSHSYPQPQRRQNCRKLMTSP